MYIPHPVHTELSEDMYDYKLQNLLIICNFLTSHAAITHTVL